MRAKCFDDGHSSFLFFFSLALWNRASLEQEFSGKLRVEAAKYLAILGLIFKVYWIAGSEYDIAYLVVRHVLRVTDVRIIGVVDDQKPPLFLVD